MSDVLTVGQPPNHFEKIDVLWHATEEKNIVPREEVPTVTDGGAVLTKAEPTFMAACESPIEPPHPTTYMTIQNGKFNGTLEAANVEQSTSDGLDKNPSAEKLVNETATEQKAEEKLEFEDKRKESEKAVLPGRRRHMARTDEKPPDMAGPPLASASCGEPANKEAFDKGVEDNPPCADRELSHTACGALAPAAKEVVDPCGETAMEQKVLVRSTTYEDR
ncbi:unnamed protein product, partial [Prorocentrum cordatum]